MRLASRPIELSEVVMEGSAITPNGITELARGFRASKALLSAVELGVFTVLAKAPCNLEVLRSEIGIAERGARDFFDSLVALKLLVRDQTGCYRNSPEVDLYLDRNKSTYIGGELNHLNERGYPHWNFLATALKTGKPQSVAKDGSYFSTLYADHATVETFAKGMTGGALPAANAIVAKIPWHQYGTVIDIGAAQGCAPVQIAKAYAHITGGGFDLPPMRQSFESYVRDHGLSQRLQFHAGDFLKDVLPRADVLILGRVLHNWDLSTKKMLLRKAYDALPSPGVLIIYERLIDDQRQINAPALLASLNMLLMTDGGFDFSAGECIGWMREIGFRDIFVEPLTADQSMVVGMK
jgi:hypothetical protein